MNTNRFDAESFFLPSINGGGVDWVMAGGKFDNENWLSTSEAMAIRPDEIVNQGL